MIPSNVSSIHSLNSILPLQISKEALGFLQNKFNIGPELWDLTSTFGDKPLSAAAGEGAMRVQHSHNGIRGISSPPADNILLFMCLNNCQKYHTDSHFLLPGDPADGLCDKLAFFTVKIPKASKAFGSSFMLAKIPHCRKSSRLLLRSLMGT